MNKGAFGFPQGAGGRVSVGWVSNKAEILIGTRKGEAGKLPVGADGLALIADSSQTLGVKWGWPFGTGTNSIKIGSAAAAAGLDSVAIGTSASAAGQDSVAIGHSASASAIYAIAIGLNSAAAQENIAIGLSSVASGAANKNIAIGSGAQATASTSIAIGYQTQATGARATAIQTGGNAASHTDCLVIGYGSVSIGNNTCVIGGNAGGGWGYGTLLFGGGVDVLAAGFAVTFRMSNMTGSNIAASDWTLIASRSTGNAAPGAFKVQTGDKGSSGSTLQTATTKFSIEGDGNVVLGKQAALATTATDGFAYIPTCAGTPTGVPTAYTGKVALVYDTTNNTLYVYNGAWKGAVHA